MLNTTKHKIKNSIADFFYCSLSTFAISLPILIVANSIDPKSISELTDKFGGEKAFNLFAAAAIGVIISILFIAVAILRCKNKTEVIKLEQKNDDLQDKYKSEVANLKQEIDKLEEDNARVKAKLKNVIENITYDITINKEDLSVTYEDQKKLAFDSNNGQAVVFTGSDGDSKRLVISNIEGISKVIKYDGKDSSDEIKNLLEFKDDEATKKVVVYQIQEVINHTLNNAIVHEGASTYIS